MLGFDALGSVAIGDPGGTESGTAPGPISAVASATLPDLGVVSQVTLVDQSSSQTSGDTVSAGDFVPGVQNVAFSKQTISKPDFVSRLKKLIPPSWFSIDDTPILDGLLSGAASPLSWVYDLYSYALKQMRIRTSTGVWIDRISYDFLGNRLPRKKTIDQLSGEVVSAELDDEYRNRVLKEILRPRQTREAIRLALFDMTGRDPIIIEPWNTGDCGAFDIGAFAFDTAGCYGSTTMNNQMLITAYRPVGQGVPNVAGFDTPYAGYDVGGGEYIELQWTTAQVTDDDIYSAVAKTKAAGMTAWTAIRS